LKRLILLALLGPLLQAGPAPAQTPTPMAQNLTKDQSQDVEPAIISSMNGGQLRRVAAYMKYSGSGPLIYVANTTGASPFPTPPPTPTPAPPGTPTPTPPALPLPSDLPSLPTPCNAFQARLSYQAGDPALATDPQTGNIYLVGSVFSSAANADSLEHPNALVLWNLGNGSQRPTPTYVRLAANSCGSCSSGCQHEFLDKPSIALSRDPFTSELNIYVASVHYKALSICPPPACGSLRTAGSNSEEARIYITRSTDGGLSFQDPVDVTADCAQDTSNPCHFGAPTVIVDTDGTPYVVYADYGTYQDTGNTVVKPATIRLRRPPELGGSIDGYWPAQDQGSPVMPGSPPSNSVPANNYFKRFGSYGDIAGGDAFLPGPVEALTIPAVRFDPNWRRLHVLWHQPLENRDPSTDPYPSASVFYTNKTLPNGPWLPGGTWGNWFGISCSISTRPSQFMPAFDVDSSTGTRIGLSYYDADTSSPSTPQLPYNPYFVLLTLDPTGHVYSETNPTRLSPFTSDATGYTSPPRPKFIGDYQGVAYDAQNSRWESAWIGVPQGGTQGDVYVSQVNCSQSSTFCMLASLELPVAAWGSSYSYDLQASLGTMPCTWALLSGVLPNGMALSSAGMLSGTPVASGTYRFMVLAQRGPADSVTSDLTLTVDPDNSAFVSQSVPWQIGTALVTVTIRMLNTGASTWTAADGYTLQAENPTANFNWGFPRVGLAAPIPPNTTAVFTFRVGVPYIPGEYNFQWRMAKNGVGFGAFTRNVVVYVPN
jgi:hypothetical protein